MIQSLQLAIRGIAHNLGEKNDSTFTNDQHKDKKVDFIMANPPFNLKGWRAEDELTDDPRFKGYKAMPPVANANYAWILHMLSKLDVNHGHAGFLLANGALNADDVEHTIRKEILARDRVEAIIVLPRDMFYTTDISVTLWIINMNKGAGLVNGKNLRDRTHEVLFMDVTFRASAAIPRIYRNKLHRDIYKDLHDLQKGIDENDPENSALDSFSLELFEDISYIMAKHADPQGVPDTPDEWLDQFGTFSIYQVLPEIIELWGLNVQTQVESKKNFERLTGK